MPQRIGRVRSVQPRFEPRPGITGVLRGKLGLDVRHNRFA